MKSYLSRPLSILLTAALPGAFYLAPEAHAAPTFGIVHGFELKAEQPSAKLVRHANGNLYGTTQSGGAWESGGTFFKIAPDGTITTLHHFDAFASSPGEITLGSDGNFYGVCRNGEPYESGNIFRITPDGSYTELHHFTLGADGGLPISKLVEGSDGNFYGTTGLGGANDFGTFFKVTPAGVLTTLTDWAQNSIGWSPSGNIILASDGNFYGAHRSISSGQPSTIYRVTPAGTASVVGDFSSLPGMSETMPTGLMQASDGNFYGATSGGPNYGTIFKMTPGGTVSILTTFDWANGSEPDGDLVEGPDGDLYSTTYYGGSYGGGTAFKVSKTGTHTILVHGEMGSSFAYPYSGLSLEADGSLIGTSMMGGSFQQGSAFRISTAGTLGSIASFDGFRDHAPNSRLTQDNAGNWYGSIDRALYETEAFFKFATDGSVSFFDAPDSGFAASLDYKFPFTLGVDGNLYGTDIHGGDFGYGSVFRMTPAGVREDIFSFDGTQGSDPAGLTLGSDGSFYGTTQNGGPAYSGTFFKITPGGTHTHLADWGGTNGSKPNPSLIEGIDGNFYGTTQNGGAEETGTVFKITPEGEITVLAELNNREEEGIVPSAGLMQASDGNLYGVLPYGGPDDLGTIYKLTPDGIWTTLHAFNLADGALPAGQLAEGPDGALYGVTTYGGEVREDGGTVFRITTDGEFSTVYHFDFTHGRLPVAGLTRGQDGNLYGTAPEGGLTADGKPAGGGVIYCIRFGAEVETEAATGIDDVSATLNANVNPGGYATGVSFQYGTSPTLAGANTVIADTLPAGDDAVPVAAPLSGLLPGTTYYCRVAAVNDETPVEQLGEILSFTTEEAAEIVDIAVEAGGHALSDGDFRLVGLTKVGSSVNITLTIRNTSSSAALSGISASLSGAGASHYSIQTAPASTVAGGGTTTCVVRFSPNSPGLKAAKLQISSNDPDESPFEINLGGIALPAGFPW
ncbi:choice-of-anchor tandem repeat GloVer-containing protein [Luteolibacter luteus]|uniref:Choice-of-anchor D domain-containing protein n=1 Tax=Luteolibacter luteus TaxID=2728835 RepID=A0A858RM86_9BACT|nr:choice-of-anchor tandem repeat GloVer-containing protein [Luteolibacter luteus]QJE97932.1 choice-of-anchor D domain-containing protein [Luteolibacter luteus]